MIFSTLSSRVVAGFSRQRGASFHTGWFVESLATQTLVLFVIRTPKNPLTSRAQRAACDHYGHAIVLVGVLLPYSPLALPLLGFVPLPGAYFLFLSVATLTYLALVELAKRLLLRRTVSS